jgi:hypothetical protein
MKAAFFALCAVLGFLWLITRLFPAFLWSVSILWVVLGLAAFGILVFRSVKG